MARQLSQFPLPAAPAAPAAPGTGKGNEQKGLTGTEVATRRKVHGYNEVAEQKEHPALQFLRKFWGLSAWMLELIMVLSAVLRNYADLGMVSALLVVNAVLGFLQERRAAGVVEALRRRLQVNARVRRDASWQVIPARELVPGDFVRVRPGDIIPADVKLLTGTLSLDESALTGESKDADKATGDVLSSGSVVRRGEGDGVVTLTGAKTSFGRTTQLVQEAHPKLHIEAEIAKVVRWLFVIVGTLLCLVIVLSLLRGAPLLQMVPLLLVLLMSAVPIALPVMFTVSMAIGSKELAKRGVKCIGVPKTIDNDLSGTDACFGFDTAVTIATEAVDRLHSTTEAHSRVQVVEVMGRDAGWIAITAGIAGGADVTLVPELPIDMDEVVRLLKARWESGKRFAVVVVAEGAKLPEHTGQTSVGTKLDSFGHVRLSGIGQVLAEEIEKRTGYETRSVNLGHTQRGGCPTAYDRMLATRYGVAAIDLAHAGRFGRLVVLKGTQITDIPLEDAIAKTRTVGEDLFEVVKSLQPKG